MLISFAKLKSGTWSLKNLFGLIPDPIRSRWHGPDGELLGRSIVDIAAVYRALFWGWTSPNGALPVWAKRFSTNPPRCRRNWGRL